MSTASHWEKLNYYLFGEEPEYEKTWMWASFVYGALANYFIYKGKDNSVPQKYSDFGQWVDDNWNTWTELLWVVSNPEKTRYNNALNKLYSQTQTYNSLYAKANAIKIPSFFLTMGFSNTKEYFAFGAFILGWAGTITGDEYYHIKAKEYLGSFFSRPTDVPSDTWVTPASTDQKFMSNFADKVRDVVVKKYEADIMPFLFGDSLSGVRYLANQMIADSSFAIELAIQTNAWKKEESIDWGKVALGAVIILGLVNAVKK